MFPNTKLHAKNQKNLSRRFPGKQGERDRQRETDRDGPEFKGPPVGPKIWVFSKTSGNRTLYKLKQYERFWLAR